MKNCVRSISPFGKIRLQRPSLLRISVILVRVLRCSLTEATAMTWDEALEWLDHAHTVDAELKGQS